MISITSKGSSGATEKWLQEMASGAIFQTLNRYGQEGVNALAANTPVDTYNTAGQWYFEIVQDSRSYSIIWGNRNIQDGRPIAVLLQYGHATRTGGYVQGRDYINPALQPIFDRIAEEAWKAVTSK